MLTGGSLLFTFIGITIASIIYSIPFAVQPMKAAFSKIDRRLLEAAYVLGLSKRATFFRVIIPNSVSGIAAAAVLGFSALDRSIRRFADGWRQYSGRNQSRLHCDL